MKLLITGATGFIGSHLVEGLGRQHQLVCLIHDRKGSCLNPNIDWIVQDLGSPLDETRIPSGIDAIIHLAQSRHYREFPEKARDIFRVNIESTLSLLEYGRKNGISKFIYASSGGIYGYRYEKFIETDVTNPINFYLTSKFCSELLVGNYNPYFSTVIFRFFFVYGPNQQGMLIPRLLNNIRKGEPIIIYGKSGVRINPIHVMDAIKVFEPSFESSVTGVFNVAGNEVISIKELAETIAALVGKESIFIHEKSNIPGDILGDNSRMRSVLSVVPEISLKKGISEMIRLTIQDGIG